MTSSAAPPLTETETPVDQLYAQVDKKKKNKKAKESTCSPETAVDRLYAQVDKKKQKSKEKEVCPEESAAVHVLCSQQTQSPSGTNKVTGTPGGTIT